MQRSFQDFDLRALCESLVGQPFPVICERMEREHRISGEAHGWCIRQPQTRQPGWCYTAQCYHVCIGELLYLLSTGAWPRVTYPYDFAATKPLVAHLLEVGIGVPPDVLSNYAT